MGRGGKGGGGGRVVLDILTVFIVFLKRLFIGVTNNEVSSFFMTELKYL